MPQAPRQSRWLQGHSEQVVSTLLLHAMHAIRYDRPLSTETPSEQNADQAYRKPALKRFAPPLQNHLVVRQSRQSRDDRGYRRLDLLQEADRYANRYALPVVPALLASALLWRLPSRQKTAQEVRY